MQDRLLGGLDPGIADNIALLVDRMAVLIHLILMRLQIFSGCLAGITDDIAEKLRVLIFADQFLLDLDAVLVGTEGLLDLLSGGFGDVLRQDCGDIFLIVVEPQIVSGTHQFQEIVPVLPLQDIPGDPVAVRQVHDDILCGLQLVFGGHVSRIGISVDIRQEAGSGCLAQKKKKKAAAGQFNGEIGAHIVIMFVDDLHDLADPVVENLVIFGRVVGQVVHGDIVGRPGLGQDMSVPVADGAAGSPGDDCPADPALESFLIAVSVDDLQRIETGNQQHTEQNKADRDQIGSAFSTLLDRLGRKMSDLMFFLT